MRALLYEILALGLMASSMLFFYQCVEFMADKDYVAGFVLVAVGFIVLRSGVELSKLAVLLRREEP